MGKQPKINVLDKSICINGLEFNSNTNLNDYNRAVYSFINSNDMDSLEPLLKKYYKKDFEEGVIYIDSLGFGVKPGSKLYKKFLKAALDKRVKRLKKGVDLGFKDLEADLEKAKQQLKSVGGR